MKDETPSKAGESEVRLLRARIDTMRNHQRQRLPEIQNIQTDLIQEIRIQRERDTKAQRKSEST